MDDNQNTGPVKTRYDVFVVDNWTDNDGSPQANWIRVGIAFPHKDARGYNIEIKALPINGKLVLREHEAKLKK